ncbi:redoxin family protein [Paractinoplanes hotanensis]|uniref:Redoxin family protein n=1 Tax=Paractinoplanes hotanensis TaxID=2906497 RepID=A0ABT0YFA8_9ACTN|nr:redoxin family protein [Actinoplanes hotanensis]MCM4084732.1 redoxin family protein [Actinoplanes hotanensis]
MTTATTAAAMAGLTDADAALLQLGRTLKESGYSFTTVTPATHERVNHRPGNATARTLRDVFGWSRPFAPDLLPGPIVDLLPTTGAVDTSGELWRSRVRFSSYDGELFVHSAFPTDAPGSVFFGPDTYHMADAAPACRTVVFVYPLTGRPGVDLPRGLLEVAGARGSTDQAIWLRDHHAEILAAGAARVYGLSAQSTGYQRELVHRLRLPYPLIPDPRLTLAEAAGLPTLAAGDMTLYDRLTLVVADDVVEHVFHPIPDPASHALEVMRWLTQHRRAAA